MKIPLSETEPIKVCVMSHPHYNEPQYDMHFGLELGIVLSGVMRRYYQGYRRLIKRGQVWFCGMWEPHGYKVIKAPCEVMVLVIWPPLLAQLRFEEAPGIKWMTPFTVKPVDRPQMDSAMKIELLEEVDQLRKLITPSNPAEKAQIRISLLNILLMIAGHCPELKSDNVDLAPEQWSKLNHAVQLVFRNRAFISTSRAAKESGLNRNIFSLLFEKWMGIRFADFALRYRLKLAANQLLSGCDPLKAVARNWGFTDTSHFHRVFRKHYGCSPSEFRRRHIDQN